MLATSKLMSAVQTWNCTASILDFINSTLLFVINCCYIFIWSCTVPSLYSRHQLGCRQHLTWCWFCNNWFSPNGFTPYFDFNSSLLKLLSCKDKSLLIWWNSFAFSNFLLQFSNCVSSFNVYSHCSSCEGLYECLDLVLGFVKRINNPSDKSRGAINFFNNIYFILFQLM